MAFSENMNFNVEMEMEIDEIIKVDLALYSKCEIGFDFVNFCGLLRKRKL